MAVTGLEGAWHSPRRGESSARGNTAWTLLLTTLCAVGCRVGTFWAPYWVTLTTCRAQFYSGKENTCKCMNTAHSTQEGWGWQELRGLCPGDGSPLRLETPWPLSSPVSHHSARWVQWGHQEVGLWAPLLQRQMGLGLFLQKAPFMPVSIGTWQDQSWELHHHKNCQEIVELGPGFHTALNLVADTLWTCSRAGACAVSQEVLLFVLGKIFLVLWHGVLLLFFDPCFCTLPSLATSSFLYTSEAFYQQHLLPGACESLLESHTGSFIHTNAVFVWFLTWRLVRYLADMVQAV